MLKIATVIVILSISKILLEYKTACATALIFYLKVIFEKLKVCDAIKELEARCLATSSQSITFSSLKKM